MSFSFLKKGKIKPKRIIIFGSSGIISKNLQKALKQKLIKVITIGRSKIDLKNKNASQILKRKIKNNDAIVFIAAEAPVKNMKMFINNIKILKTVCDGLKDKKINHFVYISSDAVYMDIKKKITEKSVTAPSSLHGLMHITREIVLRSKFEKILCILRPTLIYGMGDTHNGYGPNRFINLAIKNKPISIFGNGEEKRDHIFIEDLIKIIVKCIERKGLGCLNLASGKVHSFKYLATLMINLSNSSSKIIKTKRIGPMPHNGYRPFNIKLLKKNFKEIKISSIDLGIKKYLENSSRI